MSSMVPVSTFYLFGWEVDQKIYRDHPAHQAACEVSLEPVIIVIVGVFLFGVLLGVRFSEKPFSFPCTESVIENGTPECIKYERKI